MKQITPYDFDFAKRDYYEKWWVRLETIAQHIIYFWAGFALAVLLKIIGV
jgi:hypothetical protein